MDRGSKVTVVTYGGGLLHRRVWEDVGAGVLVCSEEDYRRALRLGEEPPAAGFPKRDVFMGDDDPQTRSNHVQEAHLGR